MHVFLLASPGVGSSLAYFFGVLPLSELFRDLGSGPLAVSSSLLYFSVNSPCLQTSPKAIILQHPSHDGSGSGKKNYFLVVQTYSPFHYVWVKCSKDAKPLKLAQVSLLLPHPPPSLVPYHTGGVNLPFSGWNRGREWLGENQPGLYQDNSSVLGGPCVMASARCGALWEGTTMPLPSSGIPPEAVTAAVPRGRTWE